MQKRMNKSLLSISRDDGPAVVHRNRTVDASGRLLGHFPRIRAEHGNLYGKLLAGDNAAVLPRMILRWEVKDLTRHCPVG